MTERFSFFDPVETSPGIFDREYNAQEFTNYFEGLIDTGIMKEVGTELVVTNTGGNMASTIGSGRAYIKGRYYENTGNLDLVHDTESLGKDRIDRIVIRLDLNTSARYVKAFIVKGNASVSPIAPSLTRDNLVYEISLAQVKIIGGQTFIDSEDIIDERGDEDLSPYATSKILPNYNDDTLQGVLNEVEDSNLALSGHIDNPVVHTFYGTASGANVKTITISQDVSYVDGMAIVFKNIAENDEDEVKLNINGLGYRELVKADGREVGSGSLKVNGIYTARYNNTTGNFILQGEGGGYEDFEGVIAVKTTPVISQHSVVDDEFAYNVASISQPLKKYRLDTMEQVGESSIGCMAYGAIAADSNYVYVIPDNKADRVVKLDKSTLAVVSETAPLGGYIQRSEYSSQNYFAASMASDGAYLYCNAMNNSNSTFRIHKIATSNMSSVATRNLTVNDYNVWLAHENSALFMIIKKTSVPALLVLDKTALSTTRTIDEAFLPKWIEGFYYVYRSDRITKMNNNFQTVKETAAPYRNPAAVNGLNSDGKYIYGHTKMDVDLNILGGTINNSSSNMYRYKNMIWIGNQLLSGQVQYKA